MFVGRFGSRFDGRMLIVIGLLLAAASLWQMSLFSPQMDSRPIVLSGFAQGVGMGLVFVPLNTLAFATLPVAVRTDAASFFQLLRNLGGAVGVSLVVGLLARQTQVSHADLGAALTPFSTPWADGGMAAIIGESGAAVTAMIDGTVNAQAAMIAYVDVYRMLAFVTLAMLPLVLILRRPAVAGPMPDIHIE
jgi:DHA2 family multidrug resistance protein